MRASASFSEQRLAAAQEFAHTMIVVDDEAWKVRAGAVAPRAGLRPPSRGHQPQIKDPDQEELFAIRHALDTEELIDAAMALGLICAVVRPPKGKSFKAQVGSAARRADIVCIDWELYNYGGDSATKIIACGSAS